MSPSSRAPAIASPAAAWGLGAVVIALCVQLAIAPHIGLPLAALALLVALVVVLVLAGTELERDVVHMGLLGAILGGLGEWWLLDSAWWHGALFGLLVGGLVGDEVQLSRKWLKLTRQAKEEQRWWQRLPLEPRWLPRVVWLTFAAAVLGLLTMPFWLPAGGGSRLAGDLFAAFRARRIASGAFESLGQAWFAVVPLSIAMALSRFAARVPDQALLVDGLLRRIAVLQCSALMMLSVDAVLIWSAPPVVPRYTLAGHYVFQLAGFVDMLRLALIPCMLLMLSQIFLGKRMVHYWRRSGWIVALGGIGLTTTTALGFLIVFALERFA